MQSSFQDWWESYELPRISPADMMKIIEDAYRAGLDDGYSNGYDKGYDRAHDDITPSCDNNKKGN